jgi:hypothetical protein
MAGVQPGALQEYQWTKYHDALFELATCNDMVSSDRDGWDINQRWVAAGLDSARKRAGILIG